MSRKLATISQINSIESIPNADAIQVVTMTTNGWKCVVKKGEIHPGDKVVYFEIDSFISATDERFKFLDGRSNKTMNGVDGYRLRTIKLRGQISQGLVLPISAFPEIVPGMFLPGDDVTELLGVKLYEPSQTTGRHGFLPGNSLGRFPSFIQKTDQERIQSLSMSDIERIREHRFEITVKMDGTSCTMYYHQGHFGVCSRNLEIKPPYLRETLFARIARWLSNRWHGKHSQRHGFEKSVYWDMAEKYGLEKGLSKYCRQHNRNLALQGEICGPGIQSNREKIPATSFYVFDVYDIDRQTYLNCNDRADVLYGIECLSGPIDRVQRLCKMDGVQVLNPPETAVERLLADAAGTGLHTDNREGIVCKSLNDPKISFKVISNQYLLKNNE